MSAALMNAVRRIALCRSACALSLAVLASCGIFETRDPETPAAGVSTFAPPVTPEIVLANLRAAIRENNPTNYLRCFVDTSIRGYDFVPSGDVRPNFTTWTLAEEDRYFRSLGSRLTGVPVLTDTVQTTNFYSDSVWTIAYSLFYPHQDAQAPRTVRGTMQLHLFSDPQGRWAIDGWVDHQPPASPDSTWSYLKFWFNR